MKLHVAKALDTVWTVCLGLYLGLTGGMVLAVILTFQGSRSIDASPGAQPFSDPRFDEYANDAVAGYIGQDLFRVGGIVALSLLMVAVCSRLAYLSRPLRRLPKTGSRFATGVRNLALFACLLTNGFGTATTMGMNNDWPGLYDLKAGQAELAERRQAFDKDHQEAEGQARIAWLCGLLALAISPWCRQPADTALQSGRGKETSDQKENGPQEA